MAAVQLHLEALAAKDAEIERLKKRNDELLQKLERFELQEEGKSEEDSDNKHRDVWAAINEIKQQLNSSINLPEEVPIHIDHAMDKINVDTTNLQQKFEENSTKLWETVNELQKQNTDMSTLLERTSSEMNEMRQSIAQKPRILGSTRIKTPQGNTILVIGGGDGTECNSVILSNDRLKWIKFKMELPYPTEGGGLVYLNEELYLIGGKPNFKALHKLDKDLKWRRLADMNDERSGINNSCLVWNGYICVMGGQTSSNSILESAERYDPKQDKWVRMPNMRTTRFQATAALWNNQIVISGGYHDEDEDEDSWNNYAVECFASESEGWKKLSEEPRCLVGCNPLILYENKLISLDGGYQELLNEYRSCYEFKKENSNTWHMRQQELVHLFTAVVLDQEIYAIGGREQINLQAEIYDGINWRDGPSLHYPSRTCMSAVVIPQNLAHQLCIYNS